MAIKLKSVQAAILRGIETGLQRSAVFVADVEKQLVPVDTGALKSTIRVVRISEQHYQVIAGDESATQPDGTRPVVYAPFVEYGTQNSAAQPFVAPAAKAIDIAKEVKAEVQAEVAKVAR